jgi:hypothetical protein
MINDRNNNKSATFSYLLEFCDVWHDMIGHVNIIIYKD